MLILVSTCLDVGLVQYFWFLSVCGLVVTSSVTGPPALTFRRIWRFWTLAIFFFWCRGRTKSENASESRKGFFLKDREMRSRICASDR